MTTREAEIMTGPRDRLEANTHLLFDRLSGSPVRSLARSARQLHVATERDDADAVLRGAASEFQEFRSKAERERQDPHAVEARDEKVAQFVDEDKNAENEKKCQNCDHGISGYDDTC